MANVQTLDSLDEICSWLGTYRERLKLAHTDDRPDIVLTIERLEAQFNHRRAELS